MTSDVLGCTPSKLVTILHSAQLVRNPTSVYPLRELAVPSASGIKQMNTSSARFGRGRELGFNVSSAGFVSERAGL